MPTKVRAHQRRNVHGQIHWVQEHIRGMRPVPIRDLQDPRFTLIAFDPVEVREIGKSIGKNLSRFDGALVDVSDGDFKEVYVFNGTPLLTKYADRVL